MFNLPVNRGPRLHSSCANTVHDTLISPPQTHPSALKQEHVPGEQALHSSAPQMLQGESAGYLDKSVHINVERLGKMGTL